MGKEVIKMPKIYSLEFKDEVVRFYERGHSLSETLKKYGVSQSSLFAWTQDFVKRNPTYIGHTVDLRDDHKATAHMEKMDLIFEVMQKAPCGMDASIDEKIKVIDSLSDQYSIHVLCDALSLPRGTYYNRKRRETYQKI